jgi:hypothetical protein
MSGNTEGAGPALAAHSKDASIPGPTPASQASGAVRPASDSVEGISHALQQVTDFVRGRRSRPWGPSSLPASSSAKC